MAAIDYISHGNPANQKPPINAPSVPAFCLDVKDAELFAAIQGEWQIVGSGTTSSPNFDFVPLVADSVTDNLGTINAALTALPSNGGTIILVPDGTGTCFVSGPINITKSGTVFKGSSGSATQAALGNCVLQFPVGSSGIVVNNASNILIENLTLLSEDTGVNAGDYGLSIKGVSTAPTVRLVTVRSFGDTGVRLDSSNSGNINHWRLDQVTAYANFGDGFLFTGGTDTNVGLGLQCDATSNTGWGINLDAGAGSNSFVEPHVSGNAGGGYRVNTTSNYFNNVYAENTSVSSFILTSSSNNNYVQFNLFGQPTTITNSGGLSNTFFYNKGSNPGYANFAINPQNPSTGHTYKFTNGSFNVNDLAVSDDSGATWLDFNFSLNTLNALKEFDATNFTGATSGGSTNSGTIGFYSQYWDGATSKTDKWTVQTIGGSGTNGTSSLTITHTGSTGVATLDLEGVTTAATASAGAATLPNSPVGFLTLTINGVVAKIPYYAT